ncbi:MAG TPA: helix-turn-helix transcriptional regulator [Actinokineospora sp.]|jgi:transcriptional regulator with XRE-family HTH domain|nr:helix-turn-helix transcriptional regulator [Actinokineospora sp.]
MVTAPEGDRRVRVLGKLLHAVRDARGWSRPELIARMPDEISHQTLASYEQGTRNVRVSRLFELCDALGVRASEIFAATENDPEYATETRLDPAPLDPAPLGGVTVDGATVDLVAISRSHTSSLRPLRLWAQACLVHQPERRHVELSPHAITVLAGLCDMGPLATRARLHRWPDAATSSV